MGLSLPRTLRSCSLLLVAAASSVFAAEGTVAPKKSPFLPTAQAGGPAAAADETIEFAGVSSVGSRTHLIFHDKAAKKNRWVVLGETVEGISAVSYDPRREQAVVKVNGVQKTLALRKASGPVNAPAAPPPVMTAMPLPANQVNVLPATFTAVPPTTNGGTPADPTAATPSAPPPPAASAGPVTPEQIAKQEIDARMLVSDLLEIGMAQRRAYEEAQRKAAQGGNSGNAANPPPAAPPANPQ